MVENKKIMGKNITNQMIQNNISAVDVCKALDIKQNTFSDWVNGKTYPRIDQIQKLADYFHIPKFMLVEDLTELKMYTEHDEELLSKYHHASPEIRDLIDHALKLYQ